MASQQLSEIVHDTIGKMKTGEKVVFYAQNVADGLDEKLQVAIAVEQLMYAYLLRYTMSNFVDMEIVLTTYASICSFITGFIPSRYEDGFIANETQLIDVVFNDGGQ